MAHCPADCPPEADRAGDRGVPRRCRGRPRLTDSDRAQRRLESRKKYDVRRVYLGESHKLWSELRRRTSLSDAGLAEYLILLNSTYGDKYRQESCGKKTTAGVTGKQKGGRKQRVSSLQSLVTWYRDHSASCPHEPQLRALEPKANLSTAAVWRCESDHSFVQYLYSPPKEVSDSEREERGNADSDGEAASKTEPPSAKGAAGRQRRKEGHKKCKDELTDATNQTEEDGGRTQQPSIEASFSLAGQPAWDAASLHSTSAEEEEGAALEDVDGGTKQEGEGEKLRTLASDDDYSTAAKASLPDETNEDNRSLNGSVPVSSHLEMSDPLPAQVQDQTQLFQPRPLRTAAAGCERPNQRTALEGSQLIIITGPSYEALASEGVQLNMGSGNMEEVTCTVIGGVAYNQLCSPDFKVRDAPEEDSLTGLSEAQLVQNSDNLELSSSRELQRSLGRSKRNRRGPVIEADGMLKMFHCPYEGCSQVYVAISSFQNHVNLVHRKGRTKVCPHPGCGKKFYLSNHLHRHMIIHSGVRDFICETCGKSFKRKNHLEVHRRTHTGETPLQCEICGYQCRQRASLNWHMKKHTPEALYNFTCEFCDKRFEKLDSVKFHKLKSHPEKQAT
ncbi:zinc finger protein 653 [Xiphophorus couchianus]|uniref:zinc finger protein 653 n=1 Tax=Xiphophorus couchianus TaxID=32473 RepID=UPI001016D8D1|nr:zinc finger protein 653 [Xiphophorus couchianus]